MDSAILQMLAEYDCKTAMDYDQSLKEIMQEIALLGLWRAKFYEHALFYGGSALRILYDLPRFSEDLDFSLLKPHPTFDLTKYHRAVKLELESFGFKVEVVKKEKPAYSQIQSAFIKANTQVNLWQMQVPAEILDVTHSNHLLKIKFEVDLDPPGGFATEVRDLYRPVPFQIKTMPLQDLFAGKLHALLARNWQTRVKGRDYFDYLWYLGKKTPLNLKHLEYRLLQTGHISAPLAPDKFKTMLQEKFSTFDVNQAKKDVGIFLKARDKASLDVWSANYFLHSIDKILLA